MDDPKDVRKLLSLELTGAWVNECGELPKAVADGLTHRVGRFPTKADRGLLGMELLWIRTLWMMTTGIIGLQRKNGLEVSMRGIFLSSLSGVVEVGIDQLPDEMPEAQGLFIRRVDGGERTLRLRT